MPATEEALERAREIARDVLGPAHTPIAYSADPHIAVGVERVDEDTGQVFDYLLARSDGKVTAPRIAAALGLAAPIAELARRLQAEPFAYEPEPAPAPEDIDPEAYEKLRTDMREQLALGVTALDDVIYDHGMDPRTLRRLQLEMIDAVRAQLAAETRWPMPNDTDRLAAAFAELEQRGFATAFGSPSTHSGAWEAVREYAHLREQAGETVWGAAFFHAQDVEHAIEGAGLCIGYGALSEDAWADHARVAETILEVLRAHGFAPEWGGHVEVKIDLPGFTWQRRRAGVDTIDHLRLDEATPLELLEVLPQLRRVTFNPERIAIARVASASVEDVTLAYALDEYQPHVALEVEAALPALREQARAQFPKLRTLTIEAGPLRDVTTW